LSLGINTIERYNFLKSTAVGKKADMNFSLSPFGNYQMTPTLAATLWSDVIQYNHVADMPTQNGLPNLALGVGWDVTKNINLNPSINLFPTELSLDKTYFGLIISAKLI
jgi:hypothetical protein